jgi:hypothetical protein
VFVLIYLSQVYEGLFQRNGPLLFQFYSHRNSVEKKMIRKIHFKAGLMILRVKWSESDLGRFITFDINLS